MTTPQEVEFANLDALLATPSANGEVLLVQGGRAYRVTVDRLLGATPTPSHPSLFFGLSADATPQGSELTIEGSMGMGTIPAFTDRYQLIARLASEEDIVSVVFSDDASMTNQIMAFTKFGSTVVPSGEAVAYNVWVSNQLLTQPAEAVATVS